MPHTPGPWEVRNKFYIGRAGRMSLAEVKCGDVPSEDIEQHEANARLIASAPDLQQACQNALTWLALKGGIGCLDIASELDAALKKSGDEQEYIDFKAWEEVNG